MAPAGVIPAHQAATSRSPSSTRHPRHRPLLAGLAAGPRVPDTPPTAQGLCRGCWWLPSSSSSSLSAPEPPWAALRTPSPLCPCLTGEVFPSMGRCGAGLGSELRHSHPSARSAAPGQVRGDGAGAVWRAGSYVSASARRETSPTCPAPPLPLSQLLQARRAKHLPLLPGEEPASATGQGAAEGWPRGSADAHRAPQASGLPPAPRCSPGCCLPHPPSLCLLSCPC